MHEVDRKITFKSKGDWQRNQQKRVKKIGNDQKNAELKDKKVKELEQLEKGHCYIEMWCRGCREDNRRRKQ